MRKPIFVAAMTIAGVGLLGIYGLMVFRPLQNQDPAEQTTQLSAITKPSVDFANPSRGSSQASLTIIEYGDMLCAPCATLAESIRQIETEFSGDIRFVWKDMPNTGLHAEAMNTAIAGRCADRQGAFWDFQDIVFSNQTGITPHAYVSIATALGLDLNEFGTCVSSMDTAPLIRRDIEEATALGIDATPFLFVGERQVSGAVSLDQLRLLVQEELRRVEAESITQ